MIAVRSGLKDLLHVPCKPVLPVPWSGRRRLNRHPHQACLDEEGVWTPSKTKNKTCQGADELTGGANGHPYLERRWAPPGYLPTETLYDEIHKS